MPTLSDDPIKQVANDLDKHSNALQEAARHAVMAEELQQEEDELLKRGSIDDRGMVEQLGVLRFKIQVAPRKAEEFKALADELVSRIREDVDIAAKFLAQHIEENRLQIFGAVFSYVKPMFIGREADAQNATLKLLNETNYGRISNEWLAKLGGYNLESLPPILKARRLLSFADEILHTPPLTEDSGAPRVPLTEADLERRELADLIQFADERIHKKMRGGLTRKQAETAVCKRREFLEKKYSPAPSNAAPQKGSKA